MSVRKLSLLVLAGVALVATSLSSALAHPCGTDVTVSGNISQLIDPFNPATSVAQGNITVTRQTSLQLSWSYFFYFVPRNTIPSGSTITYNGTNILNPSSQPTSQPIPPLPPPFPNAGDIGVWSGSSPSGYLEVTFGPGGVSSTNSSGGLKTVPSQNVNSVTVPVSFNLGQYNGALVAGGSQQIPFDVYYVCVATPLYHISQIVPTLGTSTVTDTVTVMSALRASYVGTALAFGDLSQTTAGGAVATDSSGIGGNLRVQSSGPYSISVASANNYNLLMSGGSQANSSQTIKYQISLAGTTANAATPYQKTFCNAASINGTYLNIGATTLEGGSGKTPAPSYNDYLTVTFTPLVTASGALNCQ